MMKLTTLVQTVFISAALALSCGGEESTPVPTTELCGAGRTYDPNLERCVAGSQDAGSSEDSVLDTSRRDTFTPETSIDTNVEDTITIDQREDQSSCYCNHVDNICESAGGNPPYDCACDPDCTGERGELACSFNGYCDPWCPENLDRDCEECPCYYDFASVCYASMPGSAEECTCSPLCDAPGNQACIGDYHCDLYCEPDGVCVDPDCFDDGIPDGGPCPRW